MTFEEKMTLLLSLGRDPDCKIHTQDGKYRLLFTTCWGDGSRHTYYGYDIKACDWMDTIEVCIDAILQQISKHLREKSQTCSKWATEFAREAQRADIK